LQLAGHFPHFRDFRYFRALRRSPRRSKRTAPLRKVTHITAQKRAASGQSERLIALSAFIIEGNPVGTVIAVRLSERTIKDPLIKYE